MKKLLSLLLCILMPASLLPGCGTGYRKYSYEFMNAFDTVIQVMGYARSQAEFDGWAKAAEVRFTELNQLYDMYQDYPGVANVKTINDNAGKQPVAVGRDVIDLIQFCLEWQAKTPPSINIAMGSALFLWHDYREKGLADPGNAALPPMDRLREAARHADAGKIAVDEANGTVYLEDPLMRLDVGSVAKGYATEVVARELAAKGWTSFVLNSGGNVRAGGAPLDGKRSKWGVGVTDPTDAGAITGTGAILDTVYTADMAVTTAGDYQNFYTVSGVRYHHIIDPDTLMPATRFRAVTVVAPSSAVADFVDTALFIMPYEQGLEYLKKIGGVEALWVLPDGTVKTTDGMKGMLKVMGGATDK